MYTVVPFRAWHLKAIEEAGGAEGGFYTPDDGTLAVLEQTGTNWTGFYKETPLVCGGTIEQWPGRHIAWAFLNKQTSRHMTFVTRACGEKLALPSGRIEFTVRRDFLPGHKWARMIGFQVEEMPGLEVEKLPLDARVPGQMAAWGPEGESHVAYVRFNGA